MRATTSTETSSREKLTPLEIAARALDPDLRKQKGRQKEKEKKKQREEAEAARILAESLQKKREADEAELSEIIGSPARGTQLCIDLVDWLLVPDLLHHPERTKTLVTIRAAALKGHEIFKAGVLMRLKLHAEQYLVQKSPYDRTLRHNDLICGLPVNYNDPNMRLVGEHPVHRSCLQKVRLDIARFLNIERVQLNILVVRLYISATGAVTRIMEVVSI
jgi:hypothetical protein